MMNENLKKLGFELKVVLEQQIILLDNLLEIMHEERELLVQFRPNLLLEHNKRKELVILQHSYLDKNRQEIYDQLVVELKFDGLEVSLADIAKNFDGEFSQILMNLSNKLSILIETIRELNELNGRLVEFSIKSVKGSVAFLKGRFFNSDTYSSSGIIKDEIDRLSVVNSRV